MTDLHSRVIWGKTSGEIESALVKVNATILKRGPNSIIFKSSGVTFKIEINNESLKIDSNGK
jgi:hypothetical protein